MGVIWAEGAPPRKEIHREQHPRRPDGDRRGRGRHHHRIPIEGLPVEAQSAQAAAVLKGHGFTKVTNAGRLGAMPI
jgi:hypothetical protein